jgi:NodT family efflux transporter outer membrane factor (OMF) lipoprotein
MKKLWPLAFLLAGCTVGPNYREPSFIIPPRYRALPADNKTEAPLSAPTPAEADLSTWWMQFGDTKLQKLIDRALKANPDLLTAGSRVREAREQEIVAGAKGLPQVNANGATLHLHSNSNIVSALAGGGGGSSGGSAPASGTTNLRLYSAGFDATWEADIFGGVRRGIEAADRNTQATVWQMRDGEVSLTAEIAADYFALRALQTRIVLLKDVAKHQRDLLALVAAKARLGFVTQLDVNQQDALTTATDAQIPQLEAEARVQEYAIAVLMGETPEAMIDELERPMPAVTMPTSMPIGLPSDLLRRRPDVRAAERKLASATSSVGVAVADLYPKFDLIGGASFSGPRLGNLISNGNLGEFGLGAIVWPIFHGGQIQANIRAKEEERKQAYFAYQKAVLAAVQDVEGALTRYTTEQRRLTSLSATADSDKSSVEIAQQQYRAGTVAYVSVLTAQANYLNARDQMEQSRQAFATDLVSVYKALGGGWSETPTIEMKDASDSAIASARKK